MALDIDRIRQLAEQDDDDIPEMTAAQAESIVTILGSKPQRRRRSPAA